MDKNGGRSAALIEDDEQGGRSLKQPAPPRFEPHDFEIIDDSESEALARGAATLLFDGYNLLWRDTSGSTSYSAFSGKADESAKESVKDEGPIPQGEYAVDPANIQDLEPSDDWGSYRVKCEPVKKTVDRMRDCFGVIRTGFYIHGGNESGSSGCIELNDDAVEAAFFKRLREYGAKIRMDVKFRGDRKAKYEEPKCPIQ